MTLSQHAGCFCLTSVHYVINHLSFSLTKCNHYWQDVSMSFISLPFPQWQASLWSRTKEIRHLWAHLVYSRLYKPVYFPAGCHSNSFLNINHSIHMQIMFCKKIHLCIPLNYVILCYYMKYTRGDCCIISLIRCTSCSGFVLKFKMLIFMWRSS